MRKLTVFNNISLDGYFTDLNGDMSWAHNTNKDAEWDAFVAGNASSGGVLVFGRITYDLMASFWPTPFAAQSYPDVATGMNSAQKIVFSRTMDKAAWNNTRLVSSDPVAEIRRMKSEPGNDMAILGSGSIVALMSDAGLIDEYQVAVTPVAIGSGRTMFSGMKHKLALKRTKSRAFENGNVLLCYEPVR